jgi:hypothetical protein
MNHLRFHIYPFRVNRLELPKSPKRQSPKWMKPYLDKMYSYLGEFQSAGIAVEYETVVIDFSSILDGLHAHIREISYSTGLTPKYLIIGRDKYYELSGQVLKEMPYIIGPYPHDRLEIFGLKVVIVPWIDGLFCLPDLGALQR